MSVADPDAATALQCDNSNDNGGNPNGHFEEPHAPPSSLRQFLQQYAMIVLSILTALALERLAVDWNNHANARASRARIEAELAHDLAELKDSEQTNAINVQNARAVAKALFALVKAGKPNDAAMLEAFKPMFNHFSFAGPSWQRTAWDSAIADQSASHLAPADLGRYAAIYAKEKDMEDTTQLLLSGDWLSRETDEGVEYELGQIDGRKAIAMLARYLLTEQNIDNIQKDLITLMTTGHSPGMQPDTSGH
jgi:hypothetical protein